MPRSEQPYAGPAAGWGALRHTWSMLSNYGTLLRGAKALLRMNQVDGFDCPGCAWPEPGHRSTFEFCENGAKALAAEATTKRATADFFEAHTVRELATWSDRALEDTGRLVEPLRYDAESDRYLPISWDGAFAVIADHLRALDDPNQAVFYTSGRTSNEAAFLYQLLGRQLGTNNFPDCSNLCHESSGRAMSESVGVGKGTVTIEDFDHADLILVIGQNPGTNHPRMLATLQRARRRGAKIVAINPLREKGLETFLHPQEVVGMLTNRREPIATTFVQPRIGGDLALMTGLIKGMFEAEAFAPGTVLDHAFIGEHCDGLAAVRERAEAAEWADIARQSGVAENELRELVAQVVGAKAIIACWAMGLTQHPHAVDTIQAVTTLLLLRGHIGRPGAGLCPVRGHSNVQGDRTMGITEHPKENFLAALDRRFGIVSPRASGYDVVGAISAMEQGAVRVFCALGGNFAAATPDSQRTAAAMAQCALTIHVATKPNRNLCAHGKTSILLPCLARSERDRQASGLQRVSVEDSMSEVHASQGALDPASEHVRSEESRVVVGHGC
jgi:molybdopterin-dependent oxidoreductase alpha subunit